MLRRSLLAVVFALAAVVAGAAPAQAFETGNRLVVTAYFSDHTKTTLVGRQWHGCGQPRGSWGVTSPHGSCTYRPVSGHRGGEEASAGTIRANLADLDQQP